MDFKTVRENLDGKYLIIHTDQLKEAVEYAAQIKIPQIQLRVGDIADFKELEKLSEILRIISFAGILENIINFESIYSLQNLEKIYIQQKFTIDISRFPKLQHLGSEYWKGLKNVDKAYSLTSLVLLKLPDVNLKRLSGLKNLRILHIYSSKTQTLEGIETLPIEEMFLARDNFLEDIRAISELKMLKELDIEKCKKIQNHPLINELRNKTDLQVNVL